MSTRGITFGVALGLVVGCHAPEPERSIDTGAAGALMVYDPTHPTMPGWRPSCSGALVHPRVLQTAGHCIQFVRAAVQAGSVEAVWVSFQQDPTAHFDADPSSADPAEGGWHPIQSLHVNPDNADFVELRAADTATVRSAWGRFHDSGAVVLSNAVRAVQPLAVANRAPGDVADLLERAGCASAAAACNLLEISYGLPGPAPPSPAALVRRSSRLRYRDLDSLLLGTFDDPSASGYGSSCGGDSGAPIVLADPTGTRGALIAITSSPTDPFGPDCGTGGLHYRVDTESHIRFMHGIIESLGAG